MHPGNALAVEEHAVITEKRAEADRRAEQEKD